MTTKFYYGKFLKLLGCFMMVAGISTITNSIVGIGFALIFMALVFTDYYQKKEA